MKYRPNVLDVNVSLFIQSLKQREFKLVCLARRKSVSEIILISVFFTEITECTFNSLSSHTWSHGLWTMSLSRLMLLDWDSTFPNHVT